ncbi:MAG TPA: type VI secretion system contractile sheath large subunit [Rhodopila sp.]|nr:type VI secretion system contractile sheath large subunit [Rhodopila sp.]
MSDRQTLDRVHDKPAEAVSQDDFSQLLKGAFRPRDNEHEEQIRSAVDILVEQALGGTTLVSNDAIRTIQGMIAAIDRKLTEQINLILHHGDYQQLESAWRGLHHLVNNTETDQSLRIRFMPISKKELGRTLEKFEGTAWDQSPIFKQIYTEEYSTMGGEPFGCLIGDYYFDSSPFDVALLGNMANICAAAHAPFIAAAGPSLLNMESWQELMKPRDLAKIVGTPAHAKWNSLRKNEDSRYIGLTMPRVLARLPYGAKTAPVDTFDFEEDVSGTDHQRYCWMNAAYAMGVNITRAYKMYGWCTRIRGVESGGAVTNLPTHTFPTDDGGVAMKCPTEIAIDDRREKELADLGLMPLLHRKNTDVAAFIGAQSLNRPDQYDDPDATANANLSARLPYMFAVCRFAHYLKAMVRDKIGTFKEREDMQKYLQRWITNYIDGNPDTSSESVKARRPLRAAEVVVEDVEGNPGYYNARFYLRPHYQLEGLNVSLRLVSKLPSLKAAG